MPREGADAGKHVKLAASESCPSTLLDLLGPRERDVSREPQRSEQTAPKTAGQAGLVCGGISLEPGCGCTWIWRPESSMCLCACCSQGVVYRSGEQACTKPQRGAKDPSPQSCTEQV